MAAPWREIYERFDPEEPPARPEWRAHRPYSPVSRILKDLARPFGGKRHLILGTVGTGKSTELTALAAERARDDFVVYIDLYRHFEQRVADINALQNLQAWDVVFLVGVHVMAAAQHTFGHRWPPPREQALREARLAFFDGGAGARPTVELGKLAKAVVLGVGGPMAGAAAEAVRWGHPAICPGRPRTGWARTWSFCKA